MNGHKTAADGRYGWAPLAPYDAIHVGAAAHPLPESVTCTLSKQDLLLLKIYKLDVLNCFIVNVAH
jgi:protein-L-isoaspartate O-methyltransferase